MPLNLLYVALEILSPLHYFAFDRRVGLTDFLRFFVFQYFAHIVENFFYSIQKANRVLLQERRIQPTNFPIGAIEYLFAHILILMKEYKKTNKLQKL